MIATKLYASGTSTADNVANLNVPIDGKLLMVSGSLRVAGSTAPTVTVQLSHQSTSQFATNDVRNVICEIDCTADTTTANTVNFAIPFPGIPLKAGDKLYLHRLVGGTVTASLANLNAFIG